MGALSEGLDILEEEKEPVKKQKKKAAFRFVEGRRY